MPALLRLRMPVVSLLVAMTVLLAAATTASAAPPDPLVRGPYGVNRINYDETTQGWIRVIIPSSTTGVSVRGETGGAAGDGTFGVPLQGSMTWPKDAPGPYKVIVFMHGRHSNCFSTAGVDGSSFPSTAEDCPGGTAQRYPSWEGYDYISSLLATHGYATLSINVGNIASYDNLTGAVDSGAVARAQTMAASLDMLKAWSEDASTAPPALADALLGKLDFSSVGVMGHSRGGEGITQFIVYNRQRPAPGAKYNLTAAFSLAPIDRNKHFPQGTNFATLVPACDGDVSSINGVNAFERSKYTNPDDPFAKVQYYVEGADHNFYNTRWRGDDRTGTDVACGLATSGTPTPTTRGIRLSAEDQRLNGLATMATFLRAYSGGETALLPWTTGEAGYPASACPDPGSLSVPCPDNVKRSYVAPGFARQDIIRPDSGVKPTTLSPTAPDSAGGEYTGTGFALFEWCNPDPFAMGPVPSAPITACQGPASPEAALPNAFNRSFGPQLSLAWDTPATLSATLMGAARDATKYRTFSLRAAFQPTDVARNGLGDGRDPLSATQDLYVALIDRDGNEKAVKLSDASRPIETTLGSPTSTGQPRHTVLHGHRFPLSLWADEVDLTDLDRVELRFGIAGVPATGAIQLADVAFQELASAEEAALLGGDAKPAPPAPKVPLEPLPGDPKLDVVEPVLIGKAAARAGGCKDSVLPLARITSTKGTLRGRAFDPKGCGQAKGTIDQVTVTILTKRRKGCRFVNARGGLTKTGSCKIPISIVARGTASWRLELRRKLPRGKYIVKVTATDGAGNVSKAAVRRFGV